MEVTRSPGAGSLSQRQKPGRYKPPTHPRRVDNTFECYIVMKVMEFMNQVVVLQKRARSLLHEMYDSTCITFGRVVAY